MSLTSHSRSFVCFEAYNLLFQRHRLLFNATAASAVLRLPLFSCCYFCEGFVFHFNCCCLVSLLFHFAYAYFFTQHTAAAEKKREIIMCVYIQMLGNLTLAVHVFIMIILSEWYMYTTHILIVVIIVAVIANVKRSSAFRTLIQKHTHTHSKVRRKF